jgi:hypothetical protein
LTVARKTSIRWESRNSETPAIRKGTKDQAFDRKQLTQTRRSEFDRFAGDDGGMKELERERGRRIGLRGRVCALVCLSYLVSVFAGSGKEGEEWELILVYYVGEYSS